jgi:hypothetical protein
MLAAHPSMIGPSFAGGAGVPAIRVCRRAAILGVGWVESSRPTNCAYAGLWVLKTRIT